MDLKFIQINEVLGANLLEVVWIVIGLITIFAGIKNLLDKENPSRIGTAVFWCSFGVACAFGTWLPQQGDRSSRYHHVHPADLQAREGRDSQCTYKGVLSGTV